MPSYSKGYCITIEPLLLITYQSQPDNARDNSDNVETAVAKIEYRTILEFFS